MTGTGVLLSDRVHAQHMQGSGFNLQHPEKKKKEIKEKENESGIGNKLEWRERTT